MAPIDSLERCMAILHLEKIKTNGAGLRALGAYAMADGFLGVLRHERLELGLGFLMLEIGLPRAAEHARKLRPGIRCGHVDDPDGLDPGPRRLDAEQARGLAALH